jgi:hypothetical protein
MALSPQDSHCPQIQSLTYGLLPWVLTAQVFNNCSYRSIYDAPKPLTLPSALSHLPFPLSPRSLSSSPFFSLPAPDLSQLPRPHHCGHHCGRTGHIWVPPICRPHRNRLPENQTGAMVRAPRQSPECYRLTSWIGLSWRYCVLEAARVHFCAKIEWEREDNQKLRVVSPNQVP